MGAMNSPRFALVVSVLAVLGSCAATLAQPQPAKTPAPETPSQTTPGEAELAARLADLEQKRAALDAQIKELREQLGKLRPDPTKPADPFEDAKKQSGRSELVRVGVPVTFGDLRVTLESFSFEKRCFSAKKRFDLHDTGPVEIDLPILGAMFKVENVSEGRVAQPFRKGNMFGGRADCTAKDSWGNLLRQTSLQSTELEISPCRKSGFAIEDERVHPKETKRFLIPIEEPEVSNINYLIVNLSLLEVDSKREETGIAFYVSKEEARGLEAAVQEHKKSHKTNGHDDEK